jgi:tRNA (guanine-N7-)-methyltransferase
MREFRPHLVPNPGFQLWTPVSGAPLDLEIGAGQGLHAIRRCLRHPERHLIAIEKTNERHAKFRRRLERHPSVTNLSLFHADAVNFVTHALAPASLEQVFLLYPNPYLKSAQTKRRWHNRPFMAALLEKMKPGAHLTLATNIESYWREAEERFQKEWLLTVVDSGPVDPQVEPRTHFERKYLERGERCWNLVLRR